MSTKIRGITIELGGDTSGLEKALKGVNKEINSTQKDLKDVERLLKLDPTNTELLRQKQHLLGKQVNDTKGKLETLKQAEKQTQEQFKKGDISEKQYNALKREIIATENQLEKLEDEARQAEKAIYGIKEKPIEDVTKEAENAKKSLKEAGEEASDFGEHLKAELVADGIKAIAGAVKDTAEESKEYMKIMGSLEVSSQNAGYSTEETAEVYKQLYGVLADDQTVATTTANLQALGLSQEQLMQITNGTIGAWATYGDSIPIDGLAEAINETVKVGKVTGTFADVLNWAGISEDEFNKKLEMCGSEAERANLLLQQLSDQGLTDAGKRWRENNEALVESNEAQAEWKEQTAELGEAVLPVFTEITKVITGALELWNSLDSESQILIVTAGILVGVLIGLPSIITSISTAFGILNAIMTANPIGIVVSLIMILVTAFVVLWRNCEDFRNFWKNLWEGIKEGTKIGVNGIITFLNWIISGMNKLIKGINEIEFKAPEWLGGKEFSFNIKTIGKIPYLAKGGVLSQGSAVVGEAGPELLTMQGNSAIVQPLTSQTSKTTNFGGVNMYIYGAPGQSVDELADIISDKINNEVMQKEVAWS